MARNKSAAHNQWLLFLLAILQSMGLTGLIDIDTLSELPALKTINLMNNGFEGPLPNVKRLSLISVYLSQNRFSGDIPDDAFSGMSGTLKKVYLANNGFTGKIPSSLVALPKLVELDLGDNQFTGEIPDFQPRNWNTMNLANNRLEGQIPASLSNLNPADFEGNSGLCGEPLSPCQMVKKKGNSDVFASSSCSATEGEGVTLMNFKNSLSNTSALDNWNVTSRNPCNNSRPLWAGVLCNNGSVYGLQLQSMGLTGLIDIDTLTQLPAFKTISVMNNGFRGPLPDVKRLALISVYLSQNQFSGDIPEDAFSGMGGTLKKVYLAKNGFTGKIPSSLVALPKLVELDLGDNQFSGKIPNFQSRTWVTLNLANNRFEGQIPASLRNENPADFAGNKGLCGLPLGKCKSKLKRLLLIIAIVVISVAVLLLALWLITSIRGSRARSAREARQARSAQEKVEMKPVGRKTRGVLEAQLPDPVADDEYKKAEKAGELHFLRKDREKFEVQELLRAPAEVLGSGSFGSSYKAGLLSGSMVVKRFRDMNRVGKDDFYDHMSRLGRLSHPNLLPLVAFYYMKEEKLLVHDFVLNGSLASHLHAKRAPGQPGLDWPTRLMIIKGVARGLGYLYKEFPGMPVPHGHLKSSNVLLDHNLKPVLAEYALIPVINKEHAHKLMVAYKSPEFSQTGRTSKKTDVWSLGILIFEMLTGKFPANYLQQGKRANADLASWVNSVVREEWTGEVFDKEMKGTKNGEGEMLKLLKIGMCCCENSVEGRWDWREAVDKIEELQERDSEEEDYSSYASDGDVYSSRAVTDDDFSFSIAA
ncbi:hypothetical protein ACLB2K_009640 [Fragaria x ananassa]